MRDREREIEKDETVIDDGDERESNVSIEEAVKSILFKEPN
jgi:hypothetical protein